MSKNLYEAAAATLRGQALDALAVIESLLQSPAGPETVSEIAAQAEKLSKYEASLITLQQYFGKNFEVPTQRPAPPQPVPDEGRNSDQPPKKVTPEMSPTYKKSIEKEKIRKTAGQTSPKKSKK